MIAGTLVVLSIGLASTVAVAWIALAIGIGVIVISALAQLDTLRSAAQRLLDAAMAATAGTLIGVSMVYTGQLVKWLDFGLAVGLVGLAFAGLAVHEVENWRGNRDMRELHWLAPEAVPRQRAKAREEARHDTMAQVH